MLINPLHKCLKNNNFEFFCLDSTTSTMDEAKIKINSIENNFIISAKEQTSGRGRRGNKWISFFGNIYCSIALSSYISLNEYFKIGMLTSVAIKDSLEHIGINEILFKWPNDIYCHQKKISGIIMESIINKFDKKYLIIGLGINFFSSPNIKNYKTTHISKYINNIKIEEYLEVFINYFLSYFNEYVLRNNINFIEKYKKSLMFLNENVKIKVNEKKVINGMFKGINNDGSLILQQGDKEISIYSGQIIL